MKTLNGEGTPASGAWAGMRNLANFSSSSFGKGQTSFLSA